MASNPTRKTPAEAPATAPGPKRPQKRGAKTKRTEETRKILLDAIEMGLSDKAACELATVGQDFFYIWIRDSEEFSEDVQRARGVFKQTLHARIARAAQDDWKAGAWLLARRYSDEYAERSVIDVPGAPCPLDKLFEPVALEEHPDDSPDA